jgi:ferredoxin
MKCVDVCPMDAFYEGENMLVINPDECLFCGVCIEECSVGAIVWADDEGAAPWLELNAKYSKLWPNVTFKGAQTPSDAADFVGVSGKYEAYFSPEPGLGDVGDPPQFEKKPCGHCQPKPAGNGFWNWLLAKFR